MTRDLSLRRLIDPGQATCSSFTPSAFEAFETVAKVTLVSFGAPGRAF